LARRAARATPSAADPADLGDDGRRGQPSAGDRADLAERAPAAGARAADHQRGSGASRPGAGALWWGLLRGRGVSGGDRDRRSRASGLLVNVDRYALASAVGISLAAICRKVRLLVVIAVSVVEIERGLGSRITQGT